MHRGYIKIWRKVKDSGLYQLPNSFTLFVYMLLEATHKPMRYGTVELERGQLVTGRHKLSAELAMSERSIRTALDHLTKLNFIASKATNKYTVYTIVNYSKYQDIDTPTDQQSDQQTTNNRPTNDQQPTTIQEHKNISTKEKHIAEYSAEFELAWAAYPRREGASKKDAFKAWSARLKAGVLPSVMIDGVTRYAAYCKAQGTEQRYIKQPVTFFGTGEHYLTNWSVISSPNRNTPTVENFESKNYGEGITAL